MLRAECRLRAAVEDLRLAVEEDRHLATCRNRGARVHYERVLSELALEVYARRREIDRDVGMLLAELPPLVDRALDAGLGFETIAALAEGREEIR